MEASDAHLERALDEYNERVNELESEGTPEQLLEAYVNRGCVLAMMEYRTSAMEDFESADAIIRAFEDEGTDIDDGTFVKTYVSMGAILFELESDPSEAYGRASMRIGKVTPTSRHFDSRSLVRTCIGAMEDLIDTEYAEDTDPFFEAGMRAVSESMDPWSMNRKLEILNLRGEVGDALNDPEMSVDAYAQAIQVGTDLLRLTQLEEPENLVMSFVSKAEAEQGIGRIPDYIADMTAAITLLEQMMEFNRLDDKDVLTTLHHDLASVLMKEGRIQEAEQHLMKAMTLEVNGATDYIRSQTGRDV